MHKKRQFGELECEMGKRNPEKDRPIKRNWTIQQQQKKIILILNFINAQSSINGKWLTEIMYKVELPKIMNSNKRMQNLCGIALHCIHFDVEMLPRIFIAIELTQM